MAADPNIYSKNKRTTYCKIILALIFDDIPKCKQYTLEMYTSYCH